MPWYLQPHLLARLCLLLLIAGPAQSAAVIQEVLYDGTGADADDVFTELLGTPGMSLDGWSLTGINGTDGSSYRTIELTGAVIPADGVFLIVTATAKPALAVLADFIANVDWQNGPDAVQLSDTLGIVDALQYGDAGLFNAGEGAVAADISGEFSLSRDGFGTDTHDNAHDFSVATPTPGRVAALVPIPAAAWLFGSAIGLLGWMQQARTRDQVRL